MRSCILLLILPLLLLANANGQSSKYADDAKTLDAIINAYYEVVSGPAGSIPDRERDLYIHTPDAKVTIIREGSDGKLHIEKMDVNGFHDMAGGERQQGFFEVEIHRETQQYGSFAHIWSTYEWRTTEDGPVGGRGINSIQLYHDGDRWWISDEIFDTRNKPIPEQYMPK